MALNETLVKKSEWNKTKISENDRIEIVVPFAGDEMMDKLFIDGISFESRLIMGTSFSKY